MFRALKNIWRPWNFHYHRKLRARQKSPRGGSDRGTFEGWYFKLVDPGAKGPMAIIPGLFLGRDSHAFVQVLDGVEAKAWYHRFDIRDFHAHEDDFHVRIGPNTFHRAGLTLDIPPAEDGTGGIRGDVRFGDWTQWPVTFFSPGAMGPFTFTPLMECYHGILSLDHELSGELDFAGRVLSYDGGRGYMEKDWGRAFPSAYVWTQSNHFDRPATCLTASVARIPWQTGDFRGFLAGFLLDGRLKRYTTYTGAKVESLEVGERRMRLVFRDRRTRLEIQAEKTAGGDLLHAPYEGAMLERVAETMTSRMEVKLLERKGSAPGGGPAWREIFQGKGNNACLEIQGKLEQIVDRFL